MNMITAKKIRTYLKHAALGQTLFDTDSIQWDSSFVPIMFVSLWQIETENNNLYSSHRSK